jgi:hypothetical protein
MQSLFSDSIFSAGYRFVPHTFDFVCCILCMYTYVCTVCKTYLHTPRLELLNPVVGDRSRLADLLGTDNRRSLRKQYQLIGQLLAANKDPQRLFKLRKVISRLLRPSPSNMYSVIAPSGLCNGQVRCGLLRLSGSCVSEVDLHAFMNPCLSPFSLILPYYSARKHYSDDS